MARSSVQLSGVAKQFGSTSVIREVTLDISPGEFVVFVGPSGCGKSTLLRLVAGLEEPSAGTIHISGRDVTHVHPSKRGVAMVFQSYALYPHMSVAQNMAFGLRMQGAARADIEARVRAAAETLQLESLLDRKPRALSGGQRQRVAIGRAIVREPDVFLFDEPLSNLDAALRSQVRVEIARLHARLGATMIYVTHDQVEAMTLASRIVVLNGGRIEQIGTPLELYHRPANLFVAGFLGSPRMNFLPGRVVAADEHGLEVEVAGERVRVPRGGVAAAAGDRLTLGIRPEDLSLPLGAGSDLPAEVNYLPGEVNQSRGAASSVQGKVSLLERLGSEALLHVALRGAQGETVIAKLAGDVALSPGQPVTLLVNGAACHLFDSAGAALGSPPQSESARAPRHGPGPAPAYTGVTRS